MDPKLQIKWQEITYENSQLINKNKIIKDNLIMFSDLEQRLLKRSNCTTCKKYL